MAKTKEVESAPRPKRGITSSSTAEYFAKNLQQVGFSSPTKAVLTTLKEALDNSLDACEESGILPEITVEVEKVGNGSLKNTDRIRIRVQDNGPGLEADDVPKVFGEYLASSKFGRGRCSRGQQGIGISAATTWALQTSATGARVITKRKNQKKAFSCVVEMDLKNNKGMLKDKQTIDWDNAHGTSVEFLFDGRVQLNGDAGLISYINGNILLNPHMTLHYTLPDQKPVTIARVTDVVPEIPDATDPHPHTMKLGEFIAHARLFGKVKTQNWLKKGFSRLSDSVIEEIFKTNKLEKKILDTFLDSLTDKQFNDMFVAIQNAKLMAPSTQSVLAVGEDSLAKSIMRLGEIDYFSVVSRKPVICDFKPVQVEVAIARLLDSGQESEDPVQILRFANRVPLQFDKGGCAIVKAINSVNWKAYGLRQPKNSSPLGPYIFAVSVVSPFIKFKNASKETIDSSDELVEELRRALMMAGQRLSRHLKREHKANLLEEKIQHIEQFGPILVEGLVRITKANAKRKAAAEEGLRKILGRDTTAAESELSVADERLAKHQAEKRKRLGLSDDEFETDDDRPHDEDINEGAAERDNDDDFSLERQVVKDKKKSSKGTTKKTPAKRAATKK